MSNYKKWTRHPETGEWEIADFIDDFYGPHEYAVRFSDGKTFRPKGLETRDWTQEEIDEGKKQREKEDQIRAAVQGANQEQRELVKKYDSVKIEEAQTLRNIILVGIAEEEIHTGDTVSAYVNSQGKVFVRRAAQSVEELSDIVNQK